MQITNKDAEALYITLSEIADKTRGLTGYAVARNLRILRDDLTEYRAKKRELFQEYGEEKDGAFYIMKESPNFQKYEEEIRVYDEIPLNIDLMKVSGEELAKTELTGEQMFLLIDYMVED